MKLRENVAVLPAALFNLGKLLIGLCLGNQAPESTYDAAASFVVILVWTYHSAQIVFLGAELAEVYAAISQFATRQFDRHGRSRTLARERSKRNTVLLAESRDASREASLLFQRLTIVWQQLIASRPNPIL